MPFTTELDIQLIDEDKLWKLNSPLVYQSDKNGIITVPPGFITDLASVPRIPFVYDKWGNRAHREAVLHDYLYCYDSIPVVDFGVANALFLEAMKSRGVKEDIYLPMYEAVCCFGRKFFHQRSVNDSI